MSTSMSTFDKAKPTRPPELNTTLGQCLCHRHWCYCTSPVSNGSSEMLPLRATGHQGEKQSKSPWVQKTWKDYGGMTFWGEIQQAWPINLMGPRIYSDPGKALLPQEHPGLSRPLTSQSWLLSFLSFLCSKPDGNLTAIG